MPGHYKDRFISGIGNKSTSRTTSTITRGGQNQTNLRARQGEFMFDNGDPVPVKGKPRENGKVIKEERRAMDTCAEHYVITEEEIRDIINMFCVNPNAFDLDEFFLSESDIVGATAEKPIIDLTKELKV